MDEQQDEVVYELWSDEDLKWIEVPLHGQTSLAAFLGLWCEKNPGIFRKRPRYVHPVDTPF